tara:strand:+ start:10114 stop:10569 length:456 start_codon:yes stop_codon:yes gene_type:complete
MKIRKMTEEDVPTIISYGQQMHEESYFKHFNFSEKKLWQLWELIKTQPIYCALVAENVDGKLVGFYVGVIHEHWFGTDKISCDLALYVIKEFRGSSAALRLLKAYEQWANMAGAAEIHIGTSTDINTNKNLSLFQKMGYEIGGTFLRKRRK